MLLKSKSQALLLALLIAAPLIAWYVWPRPLDAFTVRERRIEPQKLKIIRNLEIKNGVVDSNIIKFRRYIPIVTQKKYCIFALFDPPIPINNDDDDVYCFDNNSGNYIGKI